MFNDDVQLRLSPYLCRELATFGALERSSAELEKMESPYAQFLAALVNAASEPENEELDKHARDSEGRLPLPRSWRWKCDSILGPPAASFPTTDDWRAFRRLLVVELAKDKHWIEACADFEHSSGLWTTLLIHADNWPLFVREGLLSQQEWDGLRGSAFERFARLPKSPPEMFNGWSVSSGKATPIQLSHILGVAFTIAEQKGVRHLSSGSVLEPVLAVTPVASATNRETEELLVKAIQLNPLPGHWIGALLRLCCETPSVNLVPVLALWRRHESDMLLSESVWLGVDELPAKAEEFLQRLLSCGEDVAWRLAMWLVAGAAVNEWLSKTLTEGLMAAVRIRPGGNRDALLCLRALLRLRPSINQFVIWQDPRNVGLLRKSGRWEFNRLIMRIESEADPSELNRGQLGEWLAPFIIRRRDYPPEVARAALRAMLQLQEEGMPTMQDDDWRQVP